MWKSQPPLRLSTEREDVKCAFFTHLPWPEGTDQQQIIAETTEQVQYAEDLGFQGAWLAEHHFTRYSMVGTHPLVF